MWPFTKKKATKNDDVLIPPILIGQRFKYLGVNMICTRHGLYGFDFPVIVAEYRNELGEICRANFPPADWAALDAENKRNK